MTYPQAIILAIVQGVTEFLPISSSGHLVILQKFFNFNQPPVLFDILIHVGTLGAIIFYFKKELVAIIRKTSILLMIVIGTLPAAIIGIFLQSYIMQIFDSLKLVGVSLLITAGLLFSSKLVKAPDRHIKHLNWKDALFIGLFQALAILPGVSRSGSTIVSGLWRDLKRRPAFLFSFYLAIPAILGSLILQIPDLIFQPCSYLNEGILGMIIAGVIGYFSLGFLEKTLKSAKLHWFGLYCLFVGLLILIV